MVDACLPKPETEEETVKFFQTQFDRHYTRNRAPFPMFLREAWLAENDARKKGLFKFIENLTQKKDVFFVSIQEVINWLKSGEQGISLANYKPSQCVKSPPNTKCMVQEGIETGNKCSFDKIPALSGQTKDMVICGDSCPKNYPWVGNELGN